MGAGRRIGGEILPTGTRTGRWDTSRPTDAEFEAAGGAHGRQDDGQVRARTRRSRSTSLATIRVVSNRSGLALVEGLEFEMQSSNRLESGWHLLEMMGEERRNASDDVVRNCNIRLTLHIIAKSSSNPFCRNLRTDDRVCIITSQQIPKPSFKRQATPGAIKSPEGSKVGICHAPDGFFYLINYRN